MLFYQRRRRPRPQKRIPDKDFKEIVKTNRYTHIINNSIPYEKAVEKILFIIDNFPVQKDSLESKQMLKENIENYLIGFQRETTKKWENTVEENLKKYYNTNRSYDEFLRQDTWKYISEKKLDRAPITKTIRVDNNPNSNPNQEDLPHKQADNTAKMVLVKVLPSTSTQMTPITKTDKETQTKRTQVEETPKTTLTKRTTRSNSRMSKELAKIIEESPLIEENSPTELSFSENSSEDESSYLNKNSKGFSHSKNL